MKDDARGIKVINGLRVGGYHSRVGPFKVVEREGLTHDNIISQVETDLGDAYDNVFIKTSVAIIVVQCERFPLLKEWNICDVVNKMVSTSCSCRQ